jgi:hypothetical protein
VEAHLLDSVGDVKPDEGKVLKSPGQAVIGSRVGDGGPPCQRRPWPDCRPTWSRACSCSCHRTQKCPKRTGAGEGIGHRAAAPLRRQGSGGES